MAFQPKDILSAQDNLKIHTLAVSTAFKISQECGPLQISFLDNKHEETEVISGFDGKKATEIIQDAIWNYVTRGY